MKTLFMNSTFQQRAMVIISMAFLYLQADGQVLKLTVSNPAPRVGDQLSVSFNIENNAGQDQQRGLLGLGAISLMPVFLSDTGAVKIGPIAIALNGEVFRTDSITLNVSPALPPSMREGVWIRQVPMNGMSFLILEQRMPTDANKKFADVSHEKFKAHGVRVELDGTQQSTQSTLLGMTQYKISIFRLVGKSKLVKLDKNLFTNLPDNTFLE